jgi:hypothetical protein
MKINTCIIALLLSLNLVAINNSELINLRSQFYEASINEAKIDVFISLIKTHKTDGDAIIKGYKAMSYMLLSKNCWNPYNKFSYFKNGKELLEESIITDQNNVELRFLRLCIQQSLPSFLKYSDQINSDLEFLTNNWSNLEDVDLKNRIQNYYLENDMGELITITNLHSNYD